MTEKYLYRFRSLNRLLGSGDGHEELEKLEIFFAEPSQLNDPLEGYKEIFWSGDIIVWRNLLKHYINCLMQYVISSSIVDNAAPHDPAIKIHRHCNILSAELVSIIERAQLKTLDYKEVHSYLESLSDFRKVRIETLVFHFQNLHRICVHSVLTELEVEKLFPFPAKQIIPNVNLELARCAKTASTFSVDPQYDFPYSLYNKAYGLMLASKLEIANDDISRAWGFMLMEFPEEFCKSLESMTRPNWYAACFMDDYTNSSVWGTYGENHTGICLMYKANLASTGYPIIEIETPIGANSKGLIKQYVKTPQYKVDYEKGFVEVDFFRSLGTIPTFIANRYWYFDLEGNASVCGSHLRSDTWKEEYWGNLRHACTTKLSDWKYEREYRAILQPSILDLSSPRVRTCTYKFESLCGMIFGIKTPNDYKAKALSVIRRLCKDHGRSEFNFFQARYDPISKKISKFKILLDI